MFWSDDFFVNIREINVKKIWYLDKMKSFPPYSYWTKKKHDFTLVNLKVLEFITLECYLIILLYPFTKKCFYKHT